MPHTLKAIAQWLSQNSSFIITGVITFLGSIITSMFLGPLRAHYVRRSGEKRDEHLAELKRDVLQPMLVYLTEHVFPILEYRRGNVGVCRELSHKPRPGVMENPIVMAERFCSYDVNEPPIDPYVDARGTPAPDGFCKGPLYDDARKNHFRDLLQMWERVIGMFARYNDACLQYAEELRNAILHTCSLPESTGDLSQTRYVHARNAALFVLYSQFGLTYASLARTGGTPDSLTYQNAGLALGSPEAITKCVKELDALIARRDTADKLVAEATNIKKEADKLRTELGGALLVRRLRGKCCYLA